jgi:hypothetical protein
MEQTAEEDQGFQPACDPAILTISYVIKALEGGRRDAEALSTCGTDLDVLSDVLNVFAELMDSSAANRLLKDI